MKNVIETNNLTCHFGAIKALQDLSIEVPSGSIFGFLGRNGAGKTTTIRLLLGLLQPTKGSAAVLSFDIKSQGQEIRYHTGALLEEPGLYGRLSAWENLDFFGRIWKVERRKRRERMEEILSHLGLLERRHEQVDSWSKGMKQKLAIARALLHRPPLIFMDEPTAGLDPVAASSLRDDILKLVEKEGASIFLTTHNLEEAERLCHTIAIIRGGKLVMTGEPEDLKRGKESLLYVIRGDGFSQRSLALLRAHQGVAAVVEMERSIQLEIKTEMKIHPIIEILVEEGAEIEEVVKEKGSLEETFLELMKEESSEEEE